MTKLWLPPRYLRVCVCVYHLKSARVCARYAECVYYTNRNTQTHAPYQHTDTHAIPHHMCGCWCITHTHRVARACLRECVHVCCVCANESEGS